MHNLSDENEFDLHGNEPVSGTHFRFDTEAKGNSEMAYGRHFLPDLHFTAHALLNGEDTAVNKDGRDNRLAASWTEKVVVTIS